MDCKSCRMGSIKPVSLMVEQVENPLGIFRSQPRFSWQIPCSQKGNYQKSYRIECASTRELLEKGEADLWDSGTVSSNELNLVPYQGKPLPSLQGYTGGSALPTPLINRASPAILPILKWVCWTRTNGRAFG